jgi:hypothetical protein
MQQQQQACRNLLCATTIVLLYGVVVTGLTRLCSLACFVQACFVPASAEDMTLGAECNGMCGGSPVFA